MPDLLDVFIKRWKFIAAVTLTAGLIALVIVLLSPKRYLATTTALPANSLTSDKARIFNENIEALYPEIGIPDELDRLEGTAALDTIFIATASNLNLAAHYKISSRDALFKAAQELKDNTKIARSGYGELRIKVWDKDRNMAPAIANELLDQLQALHRQLQNQNNRGILLTASERLKDKEAQFKRIADSLTVSTGAESELLHEKKAAVLRQIQDYEKLVDQYKLALAANTQVLLPVERARVPLTHDKPKMLSMILFSLFAAFLASFLAAVLIESRNRIR